MNRRDPSWYALHVRTRFENVVAANLARKNLELFLPTYALRGRRNVNSHVEALLFPNYVFCRTQVSEVSSLLLIPGVMHIVGMGTGVKSANDREIRNIKLAVQGGLVCQPYPLPGPGRRVRVCEGPLRDVEGILVESANGTRIAIGISLLQRAVLVELGKSIRVIAVLDSQTSAALSASTRVS
jgi:transcriptional antiterminator NusG